MYQYKIKKINRIIDGDTVDLDIDLGFGITTTQRVRLLHIDAAEIRTKDLEEKKRRSSSKRMVRKRTLP